jgi:hypothetical protein
MSAEPGSRPISIRVEESNLSGEVATWKKSRWRSQANVPRLILYPTGKSRAKRTVTSRAKAEAEMQPAQAEDEAAQEPVT